MIEGNCDVLFSQNFPNKVQLAFPHGYEDALIMLKQNLAEKRITQVYAKIWKPRRPRTTGDLSQNHHLNGHIAQIIKVTGDEFDDCKAEIKRRALKRGYPFRTDSWGNVVPQSEADCSTVECAMLIEEAHDLAAFCGVRLKETE